MPVAMLGALLLQGATASPPQTDAQGNRVEWISAPSAKGIADCVRSTVPTFDLILLCRTGAGDRLEGCIPAPDRPQPKANIAKFAVCTAKGYRIRATDQNGRIVTGTEVRVPIQLRTAP